MTAFQEVTTRRVLTTFAETVLLLEPGVVVGRVSVMSRSGGRLLLCFSATRRSRPPAAAAAAASVRDRERCEEVVVEARDPSGQVFRRAAGRVRRVLAAATRDELCDAVRRPDKHPRRHSGSHSQSRQLGCQPGTVRLQQLKVHRRVPSHSSPAAEPRVVVCRGRHPHRLIRG